MNESQQTPRPRGIRRIFQRSSANGEPFRIGEPVLVLAISLFMTVAYNTAFFAKVFEIYPWSGRYLLFHAALFVIVGALTAFFFALVSSKYTTKPFAALLFVLSSVVCYFVNNYGIVVDVAMLHN